MTKTQKAAAVTAKALAVSDVSALLTPLGYNRTGSAMWEKGVRDDTGRLVGSTIVEVWDGNDVVVINHSPVGGDNRCHHFGANNLHNLQAELLA